MMYMRSGVEAPGRAAAGEPTDDAGELNSANAIRPVRCKWPVNTIADERGVRVLFAGLLDVLIFEHDGVPHVSITATGAVDDNYPLVVRIDGRVVVNRITART